MKNAGNRGRRGKAVLQVGLAAVVLVLLVGLSTGAGLILSAPPPAPTASEQEQSKLAAQTQKLATRAQALSQAGIGGTAQLARVLQTQAEALKVPGAASPTATATGSGPASAPTSSIASLADDTLTSVRALLVQAGREQQGGLARLYTSAALGRLDALRPLWTGRPPVSLTAQAVAQPVTVPEAGCGTASPTTRPLSTTTAPAPSPSAAPAMNGTAATATRSVLRSTAYATYLYELALARHDAATQTPDSASFQELGKTAREARAWLAVSCQDEGLTEPGYLLPDGFAAAPGKALGAADASLAQAALDLVASAGEGEREWAVRLFLDSAARARQWGVPLGGSVALPGLPAPDTTTPRPSPTR